MNVEITQRDVRARLIDGFERVRKSLRRPTVQRVVFLCTATVFVLGIAVSLKASPGLLASLKLAPVLLLIFVFAPTLVVLNTLLLIVTCRITGVTMGLLGGLKLSVLSSAANYLPLPGGPALRIVAMAERGATLKNASFANLAAAMLWFAATFLHASAWALAASSMLFVFFAAIGIFALGAGVLLVRRVSKNLFDIALLIIVNLLIAISYALGFWVALRLVGYDGGFAQAVIISTAGVIGAAVSFAPSGLGVRELAAAYIASLVAVVPALGFIASAVLQMTTIAPLALAAIILAFTSQAPEKNKRSG